MCRTLLLLILSVFAMSGNAAGDTVSHHEEYCKLYSYVCELETEAGHQGDLNPWIMTWCEIADKYCSMTLTIREAVDLIRIFEMYLECDDRTRRGLASYYIESLNYYITIKK